MLETYKTILEGGCGEFSKEYLTKFQEYLTKRVF